MAAATPGNRHGVMQAHGSQRQALRQAAIQARETLPALQHAELSRQIERHLRTLLQGIRPGILAFCWPYRAEFDARPLVLELLEAGWQAAVPVVSDHHAHLAFRLWTPASVMVPDRYGIPTPLSGELALPQTLLLPFNVLDRQGYRLGYGAGYFDRTLALLEPRPQVIGVGFGLGLSETIHPQPHDIPVDCAVTEQGLHTFSRHQP